jgi:hypothetical protein
MMRTKLHFQWDDDVVRFVLDQHAELDFYSAYSLKQQSAGRHVARNILGLKIIIISTIVLILIGNNIDINLYNVLNGLS